MKIRRAESGDLEAVALLFDGYRQFYRFPAEPERARRFIGERLARGDSVIFLAETEGVPLGFTQLYPIHSSLATARVWVLNDLYVAPAGRRQGVATALLERARRHAEDTGAACLELTTEQSNASAQALYERLGWERDTAHYHYTLRLPGRP